MIMRLDNQVYNVLKWLCLIALPALQVLYAALDGTFGWGYTETVTTVIAAITTFIGTLIGISTKSYNAAGDVDA
jgi:hypothetical protein